MWMFLKRQTSKLRLHAVEGDGLRRDRAEQKRRSLPKCLVTPYKRASNTIRRWTGWPFLRLNYPHWPNNNSTDQNNQPPSTLLNSKSRPASEGIRATHTFSTSIRPAREFPKKPTAHFRGHLLNWHFNFSVKFSYSYRLEWHVPASHTDIL